MKSTALFVLSCLLPASLPSPAPAQTPRVYSHLLNPREHPDDTRRPVKPPTWETFGNRTRFATLRGFKVENGKLTGYAEELDRYTRTHHLGDIIWPSYPILFASNLGDLTTEIKRRKLFLFDIWGYVPGSGPGGYWQQYQPPPSVFRLLESKLGERWLGMDVGEQDGRYIGGYASQWEPASGNRFEQYCHFQHYFERFTNVFDNKMATLVSLNFGHYFLKEGIYTLIGAETAQGLPNGQVYYAFIRGAGKQYGVPWFGNASVWNRWGWKTYDSTGKDHGPTKGTSLSLLKRLLYSHLLYNSMIVGFESGWLTKDDQLTPIGRIQQAAKEWVQEHPKPGVMVTPIALLLDFDSGWSFPRHLYSRNVYRVWGNLPYEAGDYLTDGVLDMLYPGYQNSSYFHDERGFLTPTPYGDAADVLLSDAPGWLLERYAVVVAAGALQGGAEVRDKLTRYAEKGGRLVITAGNLVKLPGGIGGVTAAGKAVRLPAGQVVRFDFSTVAENYAFDVLPLHLPDGATVRARAGDRVLAADVALGKGTVTVLATLFGVPAERAAAVPVTSHIGHPLSKPYPLLWHVRRILDRVFDSQVLFEAGEGLSLITCRREKGEYTLGIENHSWRPKPFRIIARCGPIESVKELELDQSEKRAAGYAPESVDKTLLGISDDATIAGGDVRLFSVRVREELVTEIPHRTPPAAPAGRILALRDVRSIQREILRRPTFFQHYDGVVVSWRYLHRREKAEIEREAGWLERQGVRLFFDLSDGVNLYADLRLIDNIASDYAASRKAITDVIEKMAILGSRDLIVSLHRFPENNFTREQTWASFEKTLRWLSGEAASKQIEVYLRMAPPKPPRTLQRAVAFLDRVGAPNLRLAPTTALLVNSGSETKKLPGAVRKRIGLWLVSAPARDIGGKLWSTHAPVAGSGFEKTINALLATVPEAPIVYDAVYRNRDEEYLDSRVCLLDPQ